MPLLMFASLSWALDSDTYKPSGSLPDAQGGPQLQAPELGDPSSWYAALQLVYAHNPLVASYPDGTKVPVVASNFGAHLLGGFTLLGKVRFDLDIPFYPYVGAPGKDYSGVSFGDIRLGAMVPLLRKEKFSLGLYPSLGLPTGELKAYQAAGSVSGGLVAAGRVRFGERYFADLNLGITGMKRSEIGEQSLGSNFWAGAGFGAEITDSLMVGVEFDGFVALTGAGEAQSPWEVHLWVQDQLDNGLTLGGLLGTGVVAGMGAPAVRAGLTVGWRSPGKVDTDKDGLEDKVDDCPNEPEDTDDFNDMDGCPEPDNDEDRILDSSDSCPNEKEDRDLFEDDDGCPEKDNDKDGLPDDQDACVNEPGSFDTVGCPDRDGDLLADNRDQCPDQFGPRSDDGCPDRDNDTLSDPRDACPDVAGPVITKGCPDGDADEVEDARDKCPTEPRDPRELPERSDGCPKRVFVSEDKVVILEMVYFDTGKSTIKSVSFGLLDDVARTLNGNPDLTLIEVAGHTDNQGKTDSNVKLSQARAEAVVRYLVEKGKVDPRRFVAVGYGPNVPVDTNSTTAGRANNRRVEFVIREMNGKKVEPTP